MASDGTLKFDTLIDSSGFQKGISSIGDIAQKGLQATADILKVSMTAIVGLGAAAIKVGSDFESGMSKVAAISGASEQELQKLTEKAKYMGSTTKFSATESAAAFEYMAMAGWKTEDMLNGIEGIMNLAAASGEDLATTSDIVTDALTAFGMKASDAGHFADVLAQASSNANTNVSMMGETFKYVAPVAGALGYTAEDTALAIGLMANAGIKSSQAGTSLRSMMSRLTKPTKEVQNAMNRLGVSLTNSDGSMKTLNEVIADLREGFNGLSEAEAAELASSLAGQEAMSGLLAIVNASDDDFKKLERSIYNCDGAAARMAETMNNNLQGQITILKSGLEGLGISLYENMQAPCMEIVKTAQEMVQELQDAFNEGGFEGLVSAFGTVLAQIVQRIADAAPMLIDTAVNLVSSFGDGLRSAPGIGESGASLITSIVTGLMSCVDEIWSTAIVLIGKLAEGIAAGAPQMIQAASTALTDIIECIVDWGPDLLQAGADIIVALAKGIADAIPTLMFQAAVIVTDIALALVENIPALVDAAIQMIKGLVQGLVDAMPVLLDGSVQAFMAILEALPVVIEQLLQALPDLITTVIDFLIQNTSLIIDASIQMLMGILEAIPAIAQAIVNNLPQIIMALVNGLMSAIDALWNAAYELGTKIVDGIGMPFSGLGDKIWTWLVETVNKITLWGSEMLMAARDAVSNVIDNVVAFFSELPEKIAYCLGYALGTFIKWGVELVNWVVTEVPQIIENIVTFFSELPGKIWTWLVDTVNKVIQWGTNLLATASSAAQNAINKVVEWFQQLPGKVWTWLVNTITKVTQFAADLKAKASEAAQGFVTNLVDGVKGLSDKFKEIGSNIVTGIWNGISSGWDWLVDKVKSLADSLFQGAKDALGINSPSKVFAQEVGQWIPPGIGVGMEKAMPDLQKQVDSEMEELASRMQTAVAIETGGITVRTKAKAEHDADTDYPKGGGDTYIDQHIEQENNYHVPVVSPAEASKAQREAARKLLGGVK